MAVKRVPRTCFQCGKEFMAGVAHTRKGKGNFCALSCWYNYNARPLSERLWGKVEKTATCWLWTGTTNNQGYGMIFCRERRKKVLASRASFEIAYGAIPDGVYVCHHCDNPLCVRPDHLFLGTPLSNMADMVSKGRHAHGSKQPTSKLTEGDVLRIRQLLSEGNMRDCQIAKLFNVSHSAISDIKCRRKWGWLI